VSKRKTRKARFGSARCGQDLNPERYRKDALRVSHELGMGVERIARHDAIFREANDWIGDAAEHHRVDM